MISEQTRSAVVEGKPLHTLPDHALGTQLLQSNCAGMRQNNRQAILDQIMRYKMLAERVTDEQAEKALQSLIRELEEQLKSLPEDE